MWVLLQAHKVLIWSRLNHTNHQMLLQFLSDRYYGRELVSTALQLEAKSWQYLFRWALTDTTATKILSSGQWSCYISHYTYHYTLKTHTRHFTIQFWHIVSLMWSSVFNWLFAEVLAFIYTFLVDWFNWQFIASPRDFIFICLTQGRLWRWPTEDKEHMEQHPEITHLQSNEIISGGNL